ncbi:MAG: DPP IV N-terminal domain-containing protein [Xanthomonadales bacterium]|nr:DPP IV N-terminal domain-containing protein [Xanthomonadales bacterium]
MRNLIVLLTCVATLGAAHASDVREAPPAPDQAAYQEALSLRERWMYLTEGFAGPVTWIDAANYRYRRTVPGGFEFVQRQIGESNASPSFDHAALAQELATATGRELDPKRLPFSNFELIDEGHAIAFDLDDAYWLDEAHWACQLKPVTCERAARAYAGWPRGWGVVRDQSIAPNNSPHRSPDGRLEALLDAGALIVRERESGKVRLTVPAPSAPQVFDPESLVWSPDSRHLALYRLVPGTQRRVVRVETAPLDQVQPKVQSQLYPKPGDAVDIEIPVVLTIENGKAQAIDNALFAEPFTLSPLYFRADGKTLAFRYVQRDRKRIRLIEIVVDDGATRVVVEESADTFVNDWDGRSFFHDVGQRGDTILWMSERDGWNHLYRFDGKTGKATQLTHGDWAVRRVIHVDEARGEIWFAANGREPGDPYFQHFYRVDFDGTHLVHLTPGEGWHELSLSPDLAYYIDTWSRLDKPNVTELRDARNARRLASIEGGKVDALTAAGYRPPQVFVAPGRDGKTPIHGIVVRPSNYDPARRYRVIEAIYAGPHDAFVPKAYWPFGVHSEGDEIIGMQALANLGFIVVQMDGMGTMNRSKAFHDVAWKNVQDAGFPDRIAWHRALAAQDPSYDISHGVGIYGASAGGQNALHALEFHGDFYTVAVAMNGCYDNRMDKISWNEQWMGWPVDDSYVRASGVSNAHRLQGQLLMIVGEQDANVDPASTYQVADALIRAGKDFDLLAVPGKGHSVGRAEAPVAYVQRRLFDFFVRHLMGAPTPDWNRATTP